MEEWLLLFHVFYIYINNKNEFLALSDSYQLHLLSLMISEQLRVHFFSTSLDFFYRWLILRDILVSLFNRWPFKDIIYNLLLQRKNIPFFDRIFFVNACFLSLLLFFLFFFVGGGIFYSNPSSNLPRCTIEKNFFFLFCLPLMFALVLALISCAWT